MRRGLSALLAAATLAGCGVGGQGRPQDLAASQVPYGLLRASPAPVATATVDQVRATEYLVRGSRITASVTTVPLPGRVDQVVRALLSGVSSAQSSAGLRSAIPDGTHLLSFDLAGQVATLDLSSQFTTARSADTILAVAQLVLTVTANRDIAAVAFSVEGKPIEVPSPGGALTPDPVSAATYRSLLGPP